MGSQADTGGWKADIDALQTAARHSEPRKPVEQDYLSKAPTTYDGLPISLEPPFGATVVVYRARLGGVEVLILYRAHSGEGFEGDWAWTPPAGARLPSETENDCARRELEEETGLRVPVRPTDCGSADWCVYLAEVPDGAVISLNAEHDRFEWVSVADAVRRCQPVRVSDQVRRAAALLA